MHVFAINTDDDKPLESRHVCYFVKRITNVDKPDEFRLFELLENKYKHPNAPEDFLISVLETRPLRPVVKTREQAALILLDAAEKNIANIL